MPPQRAKAHVPAHHTNIENIPRVVSTIEGWLSTAEGKALYRLAQACPAGTTIVEIGSWKGKSTVWLASGALAGNAVRVVAIDPHIEHSPTGAPRENTELIMRQNLANAGVASQVDVVVACSEDAVNGWHQPISLLWIDGDHSYEGALRDLLLWRDFLMPGGMIALHDTFVWEGPERVVHEYLSNGGDFTDVGYAGTITFARKRLPGEKGRQHLAARVRRIGHGLRLRSGLPGPIYFALKRLKHSSGTGKRVHHALRQVRRALHLRPSGRDDSFGISRRS